MSETFSYGVEGRGTKEQEGRTDGASGGTQDL